MSLKIATGKEGGGGIFPLCEYSDADRDEAIKMAFTDAQMEGLDWMSAKNPQPSTVQ